MPLRLTVGGRGLKEGVFELKWRDRKDIVKVPLAEAGAQIAAAVAEGESR